jgi:hypothetical protein
MMHSIRFIVNHNIQMITEVRLIIINFPHLSTNYFLT